MSTNDRLLFAWLHTRIKAECGDGWAFVISINYEHFANEYERYKNRFGNRENGEDYILYHDGQEGITFTRNAPGLLDDIWVIIP